jgi:hypothetical protein
MTDSNLSILPVSSDRPPVRHSYSTRRTAHDSTSLSVESVLEFDWHKLIALGVSADDAQTIAQTLATKKIMFLYWRRLLKCGVPIDNARRIARAIAKYDTAKTLPTPQQRQLITQYCPFVCRSGLWRAELLLNPSRSNFEASTCQ